MVLERLKQVALHVSGNAPAPHPFDPLSEAEIEKAVSLIRQEHGSLFYNAVSLLEPRKVEMMKYLADPDHTALPNRVADVVAMGEGSKVYDALVDLKEGKIIKWELLDGVQPLVRPSVNFMVISLLTWARSRWKILSLSSMPCERTRGSSNNASCQAYRGAICIKSTVTVSTPASL
jgi:Cu2+-containing amine oxidase